MNHYILIFYSDIYLANKKEEDSGLSKNTRTSNISGHQTVNSSSQESNKISECPVSTQSQRREPDYKNNWDDEDFGTIEDNTHQKELQF